MRNEDFFIWRPPRTGESYSHKELKKKARHWLEEMGYFVLEEINIGRRVVDVLGIKFNDPDDMIGVECGEITNVTASPEDIVIFHWPYGNLKPYRWKSPYPPLSSPQEYPEFDQWLLDELLERGFYEEAEALLITSLRATGPKTDERERARRSLRILIKAAKERLKRGENGKA